MNTVTLLQTRHDRLRALGITPMMKRVPASDALSLMQAPSATQWLFLWASGAEDMRDGAPTMTLFTAILRALGESLETVAWGEIGAPVSAASLSARFPALKTIVLLGGQASQCFLTTSVSVPSVIPAWGNQFRIINAAEFVALQVQPEAKRWLWQQLQASLSA